MQHRAHPVTESQTSVILNRLELVGQSDPFQRVIEQICLVADKDVSVLISGETGVGKECIAQAIHALSMRDGPLVSVNCAGVPATLLEDEFFGHDRGAFTDAHRNRPGRFEQADGGSIFLDEVGELPLELQPKLLRVLQEKEVCRLGGLHSIPVDCRVISATNRNLSEEMQSGSFRQDLYYRLNVFPVHVPALRERRSDIPLFVQRFLEDYAARHGEKPKTIDHEAEMDLMGRTWLGNVRELRNAVEIAAIRSGTRQIVTALDFPRESNRRSLATLLHGNQQLSLQQITSNVERELIGRALERCGGNKTKAAKALGLNRTTLIEKLRRFQVGHEREVTPQQLRETAILPLFDSVGLD